LIPPSTQKSYTVFSRQHEVVEHDADSCVGRRTCEVPCNDAGYHALSFLGRSVSSGP